MAVVNKNDIHEEVQRRLNSKPLAAVQSRIFLSSRPLHLKTLILNKVYKIPITFLVLLEDCLNLRGRM